MNNNNNNNSNNKFIDIQSISSFKQISNSIQTSAVVSLSLCKLIGDLLLNSGEIFQINQLELLLTALETQFWHALLFHGNKELLNNLIIKKFIILPPGPHLIEQEVQSARIILRTIIDIYLSSESCVDLGLFITPWISRYVRSNFHHYQFLVFLSLVLLSSLMFFLPYLHPSPISLALFIFVFFMVIIYHLSF